jgi:hypothetical protein
MGKNPEDHSLSDTHHEHLNTYTNNKRNIYCYYVQTTFLTEKLPPMQAKNEYLCMLLHHSTLRSIVICCGIQNISIKDNLFP